MEQISVQQALARAKQFHLAGRIDEAISLYRQILKQAPATLEAMNELGVCLRERGQLPEAIAILERVAALEPNLGALHNNLAVAYAAVLRFDDAIRAYERAIQLLPGHPAPLTNLGVVYQRIGRSDEAIAMLRRSLALHPENADTHNSLAHTYQSVGLLDEALTEYQRAIELKPGFIEAFSNYCYKIHFHERYSPREILDVHRKWNEQIAKPLAKFIQPHGNDRSPERKLRIGYVSPDFHQHVVARFLLPLLRVRDTENFHVTCYSNDHRMPDEMTVQLRANCDQWRLITARADDLVADQIRADGIDILVDLTMHLAHHRLTLFARKPAPVQATYLAYCSTTGLDAIDYRITDPHLDPLGAGDENYSERSVRLESYWCYDAPAAAGAIAPPPVLSNGAITFGSMNNFVKARPITLTTWARLLLAVPNSSLLLHSPQGVHRQAVIEAFRAQQVDPVRLRFQERLAFADFYIAHDQIDIALDPFPYGGGTTTCDALWMGVPVVSLRGSTAVGRGGVSILSQIGLADLIANNLDDYIHIATNLASDLPGLTSLRSSLRDRMRASPLMDAPRFARNMETAYREMWRNYCAK